MRRFLVVGLFASLLVVTGCGGGGSSSSGGSGGGGGSVANTVPIVVNSGLTNSVDTAFVSVTVCVPGTSTCQTVDNVVVDTGSFGLRILKSAIPNLSLPQENGPTGNPLLNCGQFASFFTWGPVMTADVKIAGEVANSVPIQVVGEADTGFPTPTTKCAQSSKDGSTLLGLGGNGLIGVGEFLQDCGPACSTSTNNPGFYYECPTATTCNQTPANVPTNLQVANPVSFFAGDNNGVIIQLPSVPSTGLPSATGTLIFGIGTQSNNGLGKATVFTLDRNGNFTTVFANNSYPGSFLDSGSNGIFFLTPNDPGIKGTGIIDCGGNDAGFYCTPATLNFSATNQGTNGASNTVQFSVADAKTLFTTGNTAFNNLTGTNAGSFDWGLGFFFGRTVFTAIEGQNTPAGAGPYFAY